MFAMTERGIARATASEKKRARASENLKERTRACHGERASERARGRESERRRAVHTHSHVAAPHTYGSGGTRGRDEDTGAV